MRTAVRTQIAAGNRAFHKFRTRREPAAHGHCIPFVIRRKKKKKNPVLLLKVQDPTEDHQIHPIFRS